MRIISGSAKGRRLFSPAKTRKPLIRPTSDRAREAIFSIIGESVCDARVLDLFAGTGALGLEALSRGAESAVFVDRHSSAIELIRKNVTVCGLLERAFVIQRDLTKGLFFLRRHCPPGGFSLVFLDPPYRKEFGQKTIKGLADACLISNGGIVIAEDEAGESFPDAVEKMELIDNRCYGETGFWIYSYRDKGR